MWRTCKNWKKKFGRNCHYKTAASKLQNHLLWNSCPQWFKKFHLRQFHPRIFKWDILGDFQPLCTGKDISFSLNKLGTKVSISNIGCRASGRDSSRHPGRKPFFFVKTTRIYYLVDNAPNLNFHLRAEFSIVESRAWVSKSTWNERLASTASEVTEAKLQNYH